MHLDGRLDAAVESEIVGYTTIEMEAGKWYQIGCPFINLKGVEEVSINDIFTGFSDSDVIMVYDNDSNNGYAQAFWRAGANGGAGGWCTSSTGPTKASAITVKAGDAAFINKKNGDLKLTFSGKVSYEEVPFGHADGGAWAMVTPVWPEDIALADLEFTALGTNDVIMIYNPGDETTAAGYSQGFWRPEANSGAGGWCRASTGPQRAFNPTIKAGQAVFIKKTTAGIGTLSVK